MIERVDAENKRTLLWLTGTEYIFIQDFAGVFIDTILIGQSDENWVEICMDQIILEDYGAKGTVDSNADRT